MSKTSEKISAKVKHFWGAHKVWRVVILFAAFVFVISPLISARSAPIEKEFITYLGISYILMLSRSLHKRSTHLQRAF